MRRDGREHKPLGQRKANSLDVEAEILLARVLELAVGQQFQVYEALVEMLGEERLGVETERSRQARARRDAVQAMREAAAHLGLPPGEAPRVAEFKKAAKETKLCMGFNSVYAAFDSRWELATRFYEGLPIPLTAAQRRIRRTSRAQRQDSLVALRLWWTETSPGHNAPAEDYREWAVEKNERWPDGWKRVAEHPGRLCKRLAVSWGEAVAFASGEKTLEEAQRDTKEARLRVAGPLLASKMVKEILGFPKGSLWESDFPNPVARLYAQPLWRADDVLAYATGKRDFTHEPDIERHLYMDEDSVAVALQVDLSLLRERLRGKTIGAYTRVPSPAGRFRCGPHRHYYWYRPFIEQEVEKRRRRRARTVVSLRTRPRRNANR